MSLSTKRLQIDTVALPSATTGRSFLLMGAVVGTSVFTYDFLYLALGTVSSGPTGIWWMAGGLSALLLVTGAVYLCLPTWIIRRRGLAPLTAQDSPELHEEMTRLVREAGLSRAPNLLVHPVNPSVGASVFGLPRRRCLRLNAGLVTKLVTDGPAFRATVRHELAHLHNRDVDQTYLAIAVWHAFLTTALAPLLLTMLLEPGPYLLGVAWRALALTAAVLLFRNAVLRCREYDADARALSWDGPDGALRRVLVAAAAHSTAGRRWHWGVHPPSGRRQTALDDPRDLFRPAFWDAVGVGLVSTIASSSVLILLRSTMETTDPVTVRLIGTLFFAPLAAAGLTVMIWRAVLHARSAAVRPPRVAAVGIGLGCGIVMGEPLSLAAGITGSWGPGPAPGPALAVPLVLVLIVVSVLLAGWVRSCSLAWAPVAADRPRGTVIAAVVATAVVLTPLLTYWMLLRDLHPLIPTMSRQAAREYAMLDDSSAGPAWLWTALEHPLVLRLTGENLALAAVVLLWLFPVLGLLFSRVTGAASRRTLIRVLLGGLVGGAGSILLTLLLLPTAAAADHAYAPVVLHGQVVIAVTTQAVTALGVALWSTSFRVVWGLLAAFVAGATTAVFTAAGGFLGPVTRQILLEGSVASSAAGILGVALVYVVINRKEPR